MKYLKLTMSPPDRAIHPIDRFVREHQGVTREALMHVDARVDGTTVLLYRLIGELGPFANDLSTHDQVHDHEVVELDEDGFHAFIQADACDTGGELIDVAHRHALIIDTPLEFVDDGIRATLVGTHENLRSALGAIPDSIDFAVENAGPYVPGGEDLLSPLTDRQLEVFQTAVEEGYYDVPRRATHKDIANALDCAPSTVDEHLRKAEARVVSGLIQ